MPSEGRTFRRHPASGGAGRRALRARRPPAPTRVPIWSAIRTSSNMPAATKAWSHLVYASSSSSVYGNDTVAPFSETARADQAGFLLRRDQAGRRIDVAFLCRVVRPEADWPSLLHGLRCPWGRPDMAYWLFTDDSILKGRKIPVFGRGKAAARLYVCRRYRGGPRAHCGNAFSNPKRRERRTASRLQSQRQQPSRKHVLDLDPRHRGRRLAKRRKSNMPKGRPATSRKPMPIFPAPRATSGLRPKCRWPTALPGSQAGSPTIKRPVNAHTRAAPRRSSPTDR